MQDRKEGNAKSNCTLSLLALGWSQNICDLSQDFRSRKRNSNYSVKYTTPAISFFPKLRSGVSFPLSLSLSQSCVAAFLDVVIDGRAVETPPMSAVNLLEGLSRTVVYMTYSQLTALVMPPAPAESSASLCPVFPPWLPHSAALTRAIVHV